MPKLDLKNWQRPSGSFRIRVRRTNCRRSQCTSCPHGPYYYVIWKENGKVREKYLGKRLPVDLMFTKNWYSPTPLIGSSVQIVEEAWTADLSTRPKWTRTITICRVDGTGWSKMGSDQTPTPWVSLRTQEGLPVYRQARLRVDPEKVGLECVPPGDPRWPVHLLTTVA